MAIIMTAADDGKSCNSKVPNVEVVDKITVPFLDTLNIRCYIIMEIQKGTIILTTTHKVQGLGDNV